VGVSVVAAQSRATVRLRVKTRSAVASGSMCAPFGSVPAQRSFLQRGGQGASLVLQGSRVITIGVVP